MGRAERGWHSGVGHVVRGKDEKESVYLGCICIAREDVCMWKQHQVSFLGCQPPLFILELGSCGSGTHQVG